MASQFQPSRSDQASFNIKEFIFKYLRFLPLFILSVLLSLAVAFLYLRYTTPIYRATGSLILSDQKPGSGGNGDDKFQELFGNDRSKNIQNEIEYIKSVPMMERVVKSLNLNFDYRAKGKIKEASVYKAAPFYVETLQLKDSSTFMLPIRFTSANNFKVGSIDGTFTFGQTFSTPNGSFQLEKIGEAEPNTDYNITWRPSAQAASQLLEGLVVAPKTGGSILVLSLETESAQLCADVINQLMVEYQKGTIEDKNATTRQMIDFIDGRLRLVSHELDSVTNRLIAYQQANQLTDVETASASLYSKTEATDLQLVEQRAQLTNLQLIEDYVSASQNRYTIVPSNLNISDVTLSSLIGAYNTAQLERKSLLESTPAANPRVVQLSEQIESYRRSLLENLRNLRRALTTSIASVQQRNTSAQAQLRSMPSKLQNFVEIKRQQENKLAIYNFLMEKREESAISLAATISNIKVLDKASPNPTPVKPTSGSIKSIALLIGLIIPALFIFILELLDDKVKSRTDIEKVTSVPVLGEVGHSREGDTLVVTHKNRKFIAEQFRIIRSNLQYIIATIEKPVILITSSFSGEGKSFIATNMGAVMSLSGKRTIVLEFDIRKPKILSGLDMPKKPGLTNYILGKITLEQLPIPVDGYENLFVLACGPIPPNPSELLLDPRMVDLFKYLRNQFDVIVMDTAPVGMVSDALTLSQFADCTIYITRQGVTHKKQLQLVEEYHTQNKLPKPSIILNDVKMGGGYGYYGYGGYGYGYGYGYGAGKGYGYYEDEKAEGFLSRWFPFGRKKKAAKKKAIV
jgi:capsular exopolysaccharide synthesis family protein